MGSLVVLLASAAVGDLRRLFPGGGAGSLKGGRKIREAETVFTFIWVSLRDI